MRILALLLCAAGCAATIPEVSKSEVAATPLPASLPALTPCILVGERVDRGLFNGIDALSFDTWHQAYATILIRHPKGDVVVDPAFGRTIARDIRKAPLYWHPILGSAEDKVPLADLLVRAGVNAREVKFVALTHAHWDHAGGIGDVPNARVLMWSKELAFVRALKKRFEHGVIPEYIPSARGRVAAFEMDGGAFEGFEHSHDLFGDGSIVAVPLAGHTPGSVGYFVSSGDGHRWFLIGDAAWTVEGVKRPAHKNAVARALVDSDPEGVARALGRLHAFSEYRSEIAIVPAHDLAGLSSMPECAPAAK